MQILGHGSTSTVFLHPTKPHALKRFYNATLFESELQTLAQISHHPNIISLLGSESTKLELCLELISGGSLKDSMQESPLSPTKVMHLIECVESALEHCHNLGIAHGDVKPANILWDCDRNVWKLCDFGTARSDNCMGTLLYMSPKKLFPALGSQWEGSRCRDDWWSLGIVALEAVFGKHPVQFVQMGEDAVENFALVFEPGELVQQVEAKELQERIMQLFKRAELQD